MVSVRVRHEVPSCGPALARKDIDGLGMRASPIQAIRRLERALS